MSLERIPDGEGVFLDANIFIYYFTATSLSCRDLLLRCESRSVLGITALSVLFEVAHRLMVFEAQQKGRIKGNHPARKLTQHPEIVKDLHLYEEWTLSIPNMNIDVETAIIDDLIQSMKFRKSYGLLTLDSVHLAVMERLGIRLIASSDKMFSKIKGIEHYQPVDIQIVR